MDETIKTEDVGVTENTDRAETYKVPTSKELTTLNESLNIMGKVNAIRKEQQAVANVRDSIIKSGALDIDDRIYETMEAIYKDMSSKDIAKMTKEEFDAKFIINGTALRLDKDGDDNECFDRTRDAIVYFKEMNEAQENLDKLIQELDKDCKKADEEMKQIFNEYGSYDKILRNVLLDSIDKAPDERVKKRKREMLEWLDDALHLTKLEDWVFEDGDVIWKELYGNDEAVSLIVRRFNTKAEQIKLPIKTESLHTLSGFEQKFLGEDFKEVYNLFLLILVRYVSLLTVNKYNINEKVYAIRVFIYLKHLMTDVPMFNEEDKQTFINSIKRILNRMGPENYHYDKNKKEVK